MTRVSEGGDLVRRAVLAALGVALLALPGCTAQDSGGFSGPSGSWISGGGGWAPGPVTVTPDAEVDSSADGASQAPVVPEGTCPSTLQELSEQVLMPACATAGCHSAAEHVAGLDLETFDTLESELVGVPSSLCQGETRAIPGDPWASLLVTKLEGTSECGMPMPAEGAALPVGTVACIAALVEQFTTETCDTCGGSACLDLSRNALNCGECGNVCPEGAACVDGACACDDGLAACGDGCVDTASDGLHCGSCDNDCGGQFCLAGACTAAGCGELTACGSSCVDTQADDRNCGACGTVCGAGTECVAGECVCGGQIVSFATQVQPIFSGSCSAKGCHDGKGGGGRGMGQRPSLDLTLGNAYTSLFDTTVDCGTLVVPGEPAASVLVGKLTGDELCAGDRMPKGDDPLPQVSIDTIARWICQGALNN